MFKIGWTPKNIELIKQEFKLMPRYNEYVEYINFLDKRDFIIKLFKWTNYIQIGNTLSYMYSKYIIEKCEFYIIKDGYKFSCNLEELEKYYKKELMELTTEFKETLIEKNKRKFQKMEEEEKLKLQKYIDDEKNDPTLLERIKNDLTNLPEFICECDKKLKYNIAIEIINYYKKQIREIFYKYDLLHMLLYELLDNGKFDVEIYTIGRYQLLQEEDLENKLKGKILISKHYLYYF